MSTLTSEQAFELSRQFHDLLVALGNFRFDHWNALPSGKRKELEDLQFWVLDYSSKFNALSIRIQIDDLQPTLDAVRKATDAMAHSIEQIKHIEKAIRIGTAAVTLGAAVLSMNPEAIGTAIAGALKATA